MSSKRSQLWSPLDECNELFKRFPANPILQATDWPYPVHSVFNPAAVELDGEVVLLVRCEGFTGRSHLTVARSKDGFRNWVIDPQPTLEPDPVHYPEEIWGIEDPRAVWLEELRCWAVTYTSYSKAGPLVSIACTTDFRTFERIGAVMPPEDKDAALFPVRFRGRWAMLHRPVPLATELGAHIWLSFSPDLKHWGDHRILIRARRGAWWDAGKIGLSAPPLWTEHGWLILYHGVRMTPAGCLYRLGLALLDLEDPTRVLRRTAQWIFGPRADYELQGDVPGVVFPCGWVVRGDRVLLYYGAADTCVAVAEGSLQQLVDFILQSPEAEE